MRVLTMAFAFLSTPSGWRATVHAYMDDVSWLQFLSTPSGWRATLNPLFPEGLTYIISIHALRVEGDSKNGQSFHLFLRKREKKLPL